MAHVNEKDESSFTNNTLERRQLVYAIAKSIIGISEGVLCYSPLYAGVCLGRPHINLVERPVTGTIPTEHACKLFGCNVRAEKASCLRRIMESPEVLRSFPKPFGVSWNPFGILSESFGVFWSNDVTDQQFKVTFQPSGRSVFVLHGTRMLEAAARAGLTIETPCGGVGACGKCRVQITQGACEPTAAEHGVLTDAELADGWRLACQSCICSSTMASIPASSLYASQTKIVTHAHDQVQTEVEPSIRKIYVELDPPTLADPTSDLSRLEEQIGPFKADLTMVRRLNRRLRSQDYKGTAVLGDHRMIGFEKGDTTGQSYGVAMDVGTTTLAAVLLDLTSGEEVALTSRMNPQVSFGDDVLTRIAHASGSDDDLAELRDAIITATSEMIEELCRKANVRKENIYDITFAGNTTMEHLLCGFDVSQLGVVPFAPIHERGLLLRAGELGLPIHRQATAYVFPVIGGFVGGDAVAGILATNLAESDGPVLMIDIGTNGEIVLSAGGELFAASTAAGPAFEGARISCGMRATRGAIEKVVFNDDVELSVIGDVEPIGLCGSALIDVAAGLLEAGLVTPEGRMLPPEELPSDLNEKLAARVRSRDGQVEFVLAEAAKTPVTITQRDIRELQLATGAIRAGINILLKRANLTAGDLERVLIAGGFGSFIRRNHAQRIGLLPGQVEHERLRYVGNTALSGARWALLSTRARKRAEKLAKRVKHVQLSEDATFQTEFVEAMIFPAGCAESSGE